MKKLIYLLVFVTTIGLAGLALAQTDDTNNTNNTGSTGTTGATGSSMSHSSSSMDSTAGKHVVIGTVEKIDAGSNQLVLKDVQTEPSGSSSSSTYSGTTSDRTSPSTTTEPDTSSGSSGSSGYSSSHTAHDMSIKGGKQTFTFSGSTTFAGPGSSSIQASDIKKGDRVKVELDSASMVQSITVIAKK